MKTKLISTVYRIKFDKEINEFISNVKKVIEIKFSTIVHPIEGSINYSALIIYDDSKYEHVETI